MDDFGRSPNRAHPEIDVSADLRKQLEKLQQQSPERFPTPVYVLAAVDETVESQIEERLHKASGYDSGKRFVLIPYSLGNLHWIGVLIEFNSQEQIERSEFIDPVKGSHFVSDGLQKQFAKVFPNHVLHSRSYLTHEDQTKSAVLTVANLLSAVQHTVLLQTNIQDKEAFHIRKSNDTTNEGNQSKFQELSRTLNNGLAKRNILDATKLPEGIQEAETQIQRYEKQGRTEEAKKEREYLNELKELLQLSEKIADLRSVMSSSENLKEAELRHLEETLMRGLEKRKIQNTSNLSVEMQQAETQIQRCEKLGRTDEANKEKEYLNELKELLQLSEKIASFKSVMSSPENTKNAELRRLKQTLMSGLEKRKIQDTKNLYEEIQQTETQIQRCEKLERMEEAKKEKEYLNELKELTALSDRIKSLECDRPITNMSRESALPNSVQGLPNNTFSTVVNAEKKSLEDLNTLRGDWTGMPSCAEQSAMQLLEHFQRILLRGDERSSEDLIFVNATLNQLQRQIKKEELFSVKIQESVQDLERYVLNHDVLSTVYSLRELLTTIRPLYVQEIHRLVDKAKVAGKLIHGKDIVLLLGETGTGKSTTIQFLAGSKMKRTKVEVEPGRFLEHITADGPITNPGLENVISSARNKSETRYIAPVTIQLKDILGPHESGEIILCDAPGFGDTAGPEVDVANSVGVIEAIKGCKSVKILALSSYKSLGDRGQGIQRLAHLLINMVHGIQGRLSAILYAFTKYPSNTDVSALLIDIKKSKVDTDPLLRSDSAFVTVLTDMINKTRQGAENIDPICGDRKNIVEKLKNVSGIMYPEEVFRFSMSEETQACIANQAQRDNSSIRCAFKHKDIDLVVYNLNKLKTLKDLLEHSTARDTYEDAIRFVSESISEYCTGVTKKFNRALASQDGLGREDIDEYKSAIEYIQQIQKLSEHLGANLLSPESLMQNVHTELQKRSQALIKEELYSLVVGVYFRNLRTLKDTFTQLESFYKKSCESFAERFENLAQSAREPIYSHDFNTVAEIILKVSKCLPILNSHLNGLVEGRYKNIVQSLLRHLNSCFEKADPILARIRLSDGELEIVKDYVSTLKLANENSALQDRISTYVEMLTKTNDKSVEMVSDNYSRLLEKIVNYFHQINNRISELLSPSGDRALEDTETLVNDMDAIRTIPEIESKTAGAYYRTVESIRGRMQQLQREVEELLFPLDLQSETLNYAKIARLVSRLKNAKWMNRVSPGAYDISINRVTEELIQYFHQLEDSLMKLDLSLKCPENVSVAQGIFDKIESLSVLERSVPELKTWKEAMVQRFIDSVQGNFNRIQEKFNLEDITVYQLKQELKDLEQIKREYENLHPACVFLQKHDFADISKLNLEIDELEEKQQAEIQQENEKKSKIESELNSLRSLIQQCDPSTLDTIRETVQKAEQCFNDQIGILEEMQKKHNNSLTPLKSIRKQYESLLVARDSASPEQNYFLQQKEQDSIESLNNTIEEKKETIAERQNNKQSYDFNNRFEASTADIALLYTSNCEKIANVRLKELATETNERLKKYISEYGSFLEHEIERLFKSLTTIGSQGSLFQYSQELEVRLEQLSSLSEFKRVFDCIEGSKKVARWRRKFSEQLRNMSGMMEEHKESGRNDELREQLTIAQGLMVSDQVWDEAFLSDGFGALYRKYQVEATKESKKAYRVVLECISRGDYANADKALADVDEKTSNPKDIAQIKHDLQTSLRRVMQSTRRIVNDLDPKIDFKENNEGLTREINENIGKISTVLSKAKLMGLIEESIQGDLMGFEESIGTLLSAMLLKRLTSIEEFMNSDDAFEAEQSMENLGRIERALDNHFTLENVSQKAKKVTRKIDTLASDISERNDFKAIEKYSKKSPREFLAKLEKASTLRPTKYGPVRALILEEIQLHFDTAINNVYDAPIEKRSAQMRPLSSALRFLPEDLQNSFRPRIIELTNKFVEEEYAYKQELKGFLETERADDSTIKRLNDLAAQYKQEKRYEPLEILRSGVVKKLNNHWESVQNASDKGDVQSSINSMKQIIKYQENVQNLSEVEEFYRKVCTLISYDVVNYSSTLSNIFKIEKTQTVDGAFSNIILYIELGQEFPGRIHELLSEKSLQSIEYGLKTMYESWHSISSTFRISMNELNIKSLHEVIKIMERWDGFLQKIRTCPCRHDLIQSSLNAMKNLTFYLDMISELQRKLIELAQHLDAELTSDETTRYEVIRDQFFNNLAISVQVLKSISSEFQNSLLSMPDVERLEKALQVRVEELQRKLFLYASQDQFLSSDSDYFRMYYNHLMSFDKYVRLPDVKIRHSLELAETQIFDKVTILSRDIANAGGDVTKVAELLVKMKFYAENFSMFDTKINGMIDEALKSYKGQQGPLVLSQLTMVLEKTDVGSRLIAEHSSLIGEDWKRRREKMQKQDDLDYVIGELEGDDIATDVLRARYKTFRQVYDDLISKILGSFNSKAEKEPNIEVLIAQTKVLIGTVTHNRSEVTWDHSFRDRIPELLGHIFAVWTLKNTQHYNAMRSIDASQAYLLMPHVAQIIAIFRILGIGCTKSSTVFGYHVPFTRRISDDLINNLAQIGTGEGKSVVMAITACVFALVGVDVNCSCYSEYLSMRDKNDFASVFRTLGIEERIEYGTFNKLCENFLNEQCNVRERVRDMIINNKNVIDVVQATTRIRPKVLLIDEIDVFLSEKFYGGMYTPSVYLNDPVLKSLLDALWQNRNIRTLKAVRALPAYETCATRFSNWIFLFDEAIKDMLSALQSYQLSTHIVHNDKIVYVEGESIAENVVRGYDTIWAYYYENENGRISQNSLETNVGIIINCGTFSYAEMPHEFAYITGVTGTLKTLAQPENKILQNVYQIHMNTYMPSVFGKSNRNYNSVNDVEAVNNTEYFTRIRGEIDTMRNAERAILVFFESEEKLTAFHNSSELSSIRQDVQTVTEKASGKERELCIKRAASEGKVTLLTRTFGRGTDFICRNQRVLANGGIHVLQTFFSGELSEEYQIMGRGARQGDRGSYRMILLDSDLEWVLGTAWKEEIPNITGSALYAALNKARNALYESKCAAKEVGIKQCKREHEASKSFMNALCERKIDIVKMFLTEQNRGANINSGTSRTLLLMDATNSMSGLLVATKDTVCTMFERASAVLEETGFSKDAFSMQFAIYRNYNSESHKILEVSSWETRASNLRTFMNRIGPEGGWRHEAIEIGLWHAVKESETQDEISQVILIGDAPANTKSEVTGKRRDLGEVYWRQTRFATPTYYEDELQKLRNKNIPVHALYLTDFARENFEKIAKETKGRCEFLNIYSAEGAKLLTNFITEEVLRKTAGDSAVELYREKYSKTTFTS